MKITKAASKCAAVLCAMAVMMPAAGAVPAAFAGFGSNPVVASAEEYDWNVTAISNDQYVKLGGTFNFEVTVGSWVKNPTYQWEIASYGSGFNWQAISGATSSTLHGKMTSAYSGAHVRCKVTDSSRKITDYSPVRTVCSTEAAAKLGTPVKQSNGYYKIPLTVTGLYNRSLGMFTPEFTFDPSAVADIDFEYSSNMKEGDNCGFGFTQANKAIDSNNDGETDKVEKVAGHYLVSYATMFTPAILGTDNVFGYLYVKPNSGVSTVKIDLSSYDNTEATLYGDAYEGILTYGMSYTGTTISTGSTTTSTVPVVKSIDYNTQFHQFRVIWDSVPNAQAYGIAYYSAGKWRVYTQSIAPTTTYWTSPKLTAGKAYKLAIAAKVGGTWDTTGAIKNAITVTVK